MLNLLFIILLIFNQTNCININDDLANLQVADSKINIKPSTSATHSINYSQTTTFSFGATGDILQVNIHGINCNFKIDNKVDIDILNKTNLDTYSLRIRSQKKEISITPIVDIIEGEHKENYEIKSCPLSINSFLVRNNNNLPLQIQNKEKNIIYLANSINNALTLNYEIGEVSNDSFISLYFQLNEKSDISIKIFYNNDQNPNNSISKNIAETRNIFLNSEFLKKGILSINIINNDIKPIIIRFRLIEKESISIIEKEALNFGFLTSKTTYQYYYTEVFEGEEGELMLHNKRLYGELYAKLIIKNETTYNQLNNRSIYPKEPSKENLKYNPHNLKLSYNYENTSICANGCYLLITYKQNKSEGDFPLIGYEFTILYRSWNYSDYISDIIDIPFNEYILGSFESGSISYHYYSISLPSDVENIIIQLEGNYIDGFYGEGRQKVNTAKLIGNNGQLQIISNKNVLSLNITDLKYKEKMSFAFRSKDFFVDIYPFYYFRVLYTKKNEELIFPIDSQFGNLCLPKSDNKNDKNKYYCNLILRNDYNEFAANFSISSSVPNQLFILNTTEVYKNKSTVNSSYKFIYYTQKAKNDIDYYMFKFEFYNNEVKDIITCFTDKVKDMYPQIYSYQMFYLSKSTKVNYFDLEHKYTLNYMFVYGDGGFINVSLLNYTRFSSSRNFRGRLMAFPIGSKQRETSFYTSNPAHIFCYQIIYNMKNKGIEELKPEGTLTQFVTEGHFPLYYFLKLKNQNYANIDVNLRLYSYDENLIQNNFDIRGYMLDEDKIKRKINGEYIDLNNPIMGNYSYTFKVGLLQVNQIIKNETYYILIEIMNKGLQDIKSPLLVDLVTKEYTQEIYYIPINQYIQETFDGENNTIKKENKYYLSSLQKGSDQSFIELSSGFDDIKIEFDKSCNATYEFEYFKGFKKYRVYESNNYDVYFSVVNPNEKNASYMIRYFFTGKGGEYLYTLNLNCKKEIISLSEENATISLTFDSINVTYHSQDVGNNPRIYFDIYGLLYKMNENSSEQLNTTCSLIEQNPSYTSRTRHEYDITHTQNWSLLFTNISREKSYIYDLQLQINVVLEKNYYNEEFLIFTTKVDLTDIALEDKKKIDLWLILGPSLGFIGLVVIIFLLVKYIRLNKKNISLEENIKSIEYSSLVQKNVISKEKNLAEKDKDYETTFI